MIKENSFINDLRAEREINKGIKEVEHKLDKLLKTIADIQISLDKIKSGENPDYDFVMTTLAVLYDKQGRTTKTELADLLVGYKKILGDKYWTHGQTRTIERIEHLMRRREIHAEFVKGGKMILEPIEVILEKYPMKHKDLIEKNFIKAMEHKTRIIEQKRDMTTQREGVRQKIVVKDILEETKKDENMIDNMVNELIQKKDE